MEISSSIIELKPGSIDRVREWACFINSHKEEALETLANEGVTIESFFLVELNGKNYLIGYMRAGSVEKAHEAVKTSLMKIDAYHQEFKKEAWINQIPAEFLVDLSRIADEENYA